MQSLQQTPLNTVNFRIESAVATIRNLRDSYLFSITYLYNAVRLLLQEFPRVNRNTASLLRASIKQQEMDANLLDLLCNQANKAVEDHCSPYLPLVSTASLLSQHTLTSSFPFLPSQPTSTRCCWKCSVQLQRTSTALTRPAYKSTACLATCTAGLPDCK